MDQGIDIAAYLESGILELYVSGALPEEEAAEVSRLSRIHPEILAEIERIESDFIQLAESYDDSEPSASILDNVLTEIKKDTSIPKTLPLDPPAEPQNTNIRRLNPWLLAAASIALLISIGFNLWQFLDRQDLRSQSQAGVRQIDSLSTRLALQEPFIQHQTNPNSMRVLLNTAVPEKDYSAEAVWNPVDKKLMLLKGNLPEPPQGFQYQMWTITDNQPTSAGLIDFAEDLQFLDAVGTLPDAFAISLEAEGGSEQPNFEAIYVVGNTAG